MRPHLTKVARSAKALIRSMVPLPIRRRLALALGRGPRGYGWPLVLLRDWAERDPNAFHRFLWSNHLAYAETYDVERRFGPEHIHPTRRMLFTDLDVRLREKGLDPSRDIRSVFEVGCSLGYLLRHLETVHFPAAAILEGNDIDRYAVERGHAYLTSAGSRVRLHAADMTDLPRIMGDRKFDIVFAAGVLMYLRESDAADIVATMLRRTRVLAVFAGLAHPEQDNTEMAASTRRERDDTFIHNIDAMVARAGGRVVYRRWEGNRTVEGNTVYFVFAEPG